VSPEFPVGASAEAFASVPEDEKKADGSRMEDGIHDVWESQVVDQVIARIRSVVVGLVARTGVVGRHLCVS
jgi:hypothetical protein